VAAPPSYQRRAADRHGDGAAGRDRLLRIAFSLILIVTAGGLGWWGWQRVRGGAARDSDPAWDRDSDRVFFTSRRAGQADIWAARLSDGHPAAVFEQPSRESHAVPSPDGRWLAFESDRDGNFEIYVSKANGEGPKQLTRDAGQDRFPSWSPDGLQIVFASSRSNPEMDLYRMAAADGSGLEQLTSGGANSAPQFSPDGANIAFTSGRDVHVLNLKSRQVRRVTHEPLNGLHPSWSPNGRELTFMSWRNGRAEIFVSRADGTEETLLVSMPAGDAVDPVWSPNGQYIAFVHRPGGADETSSEILYAVDVATRRLTRISR
jgi:TolB protein